MAKRIITISREFGSGGRFIGEEVAKKLGIAYYDKNIINHIAEESGLSPDYIQEKATDFWKNHVVKKIPPMLDGSDSYSKYLLEKADKENEEVIELNGLNAKAEEIKALEEQMKSLEQQIKLKKQEILLELNNNHCNKAISTDFKFSIAIQERSSVDKELMEKENPELVAQYKEVEKRYSTPKEIKFIKIAKNTQKKKEVA